MTKAEKRANNREFMRRKRLGLPTRGYVRRGLKGWNNLFKAVRG